MGADPTVLVLVHEVRLNPDIATFGGVVYVALGVEVATGAHVAFAVHPSAMNSLPDGAEGVEVEVSRRLVINRPTQKEYTR